VSCRVLDSADGGLGRACLSLLYQRFELLLLQLLLLVHHVT
jgi:hypothetical protein